MTTNKSNPKTFNSYQPHKIMMIRVCTNVDHPRCPKMTSKIGLKIVLCSNLHYFNIFALAKIPLSYLPNPSARAVYDTWSIFKRSLTGLNSEFSFS